MCLYLQQSPVSLQISQRPRELDLIAQATQASVRSRRRN
jgi:hypothetical protein